jgi:uncharacterized membrane protein
MLTDLYSNVHLLLRWIHVLAGIIWIGHLYFFTFVNVPFQGTIGPDVKKVVNPQMLGRALWWFRWGAMITLVAGLALFTQLYMYTPGVGFGPSAMFSTADGMSGRSVWILIGMAFGFTMWFNVWFVIWPAQRKILPAVRDGTAVDPALARKVLRTSRANAYMSGPLLFGMLAPSHYGAISVVGAALAIGLGLLAIWWAIRVSPTVGTSV